MIIIKNVINELIRYSILRKTNSKRGLSESLNDRGKTVILSKKIKFNIVESLGKNLFLVPTQESRNFY